MTSFEIQKQHSDRCMPEVISIIKQHLDLVKLTTLEQDQTQNADLSVESTSVSVRSRSYAKLPYRNEFTIRSLCRGRGPTELDKLAAGYGRYFFYSFENQLGDGLSYWVLGDLAEIRRVLFFRPELKNNEFHNGDGTSFVCFYWSDFQRAVIASKDNLLPWEDKCPENSNVISIR